MDTKNEGVASFDNFSLFFCKNSMLDSSDNLTEITLLLGI